MDKEKELSKKDLIFPSLFQENMPQSQLQLHLPTISRNTITNLGCNELNQKEQHHNKVTARKKNNLPVYRVQRTDW